MTFPYTNNQPLMKLKILGPNGIKEYDAYLDTGATKTLIPEKDARELKLSYSGDIAIITASGSPSNFLG